MHNAPTQNIQDELLCGRWGLPRSESKWFDWASDASWHQERSWCGAPLLPATWISGACAIFRDLSQRVWLYKSFLHVSSSTRASLQCRGGKTCGNAVVSQLIVCFCLCVVVFSLWQDWIVMLVATGCWLCLVIGLVFFCMLCWVILILVPWWD